MSLNPNPNGAPTFTESEQMAAAEPGWWERVSDRVFFAAVVTAGSAVAGGVVWGWQQLGGHA